MPTDIHILEEALHHAWAASTSYDPADWSFDNPAWGQCAVTATVVQDHLGGDIAVSDAQLPDGRQIMHFHNVLDGVDVDLTSAQFPEGTRICNIRTTVEGYTSPREYILAFAETVRRYEELKMSVESLIASDSQSRD